LSFELRKENYPAGRGSDQRRGLAVMRETDALHRGRPGAQAKKEVLPEGGGGGPKLDTPAKHLSEKKKREKKISY